MNKQEKLDMIFDKVKTCKKCPLFSESTIHPGMGRGNPESEIVLLGEAQGQDETEQGGVFVGRAGKMLDKIIAAVGWTPNDVYICNILKCRPPNNRKPMLGEADNCFPFLQLQLRVIAPKYIICLGASAAYFLLRPKCRPEEYKIGQNRKQWFDWNGIKIIATYHPSYLLRNPSAKKEVWDDLQFFLETKKSALQPQEEVI